LRPIPLDSSLLPYHFHPYHFSAKISDPARSLFSSPIIMAHTHNQELESCFNTLQSGLLETQQEVQKLSATIASCAPRMAARPQNFASDPATAEQGAGSPEVLLASGRASIQRFLVFK
jgi:hypothetical protein